MNQTVSSDKRQNGLNSTVFFGATIIIVAVTLFAFFSEERASELFNNLQNHIIAYAGWFYIAAVAVFLIVSIYLALSRYGNIKLGPDHSSPDYDNFSWFAMLFSAGMGIGLMFYGVAEPVMHFLNPPNIEGRTVAAARDAMSLTFFHWGLHAWAIYAVVALILAVFSFRHNLPLSMRSALYPLIGDKIYGPIGDAVDIFAIVGTLFGVATSLGLGVNQVNAGLSHLIPSIPQDTNTQIILIIAITFCATLSVVTGLDKGIKFLSNLNILFAILLVGFVLFNGATVYTLQAFMQNIGQYLSTVVRKTFNLYAYTPESDAQKWVGGWTLLYWGWWVSWAPFVGMFIARVSRGRTIREFITGVLLVPTGFTFIWMTVFGNNAIHMILDQGITMLGEAVSTDVSTALFAFLEQLPMSSITAPLAMIMVVLFFVTSADSGSMVIDTLANNGAEKTPVWSRVYWASLEGIIAVVLLFAGGLGALQTMTIASALPFAIIMMFALYGLFKVLALDLQKQDALAFNAYLPQTTAGTDWRERLRTITEYPNEEKVRHYIETTVRPTLEEIAQEMRKNDAGEVIISQLENGGLRFHVEHGKAHDFYYDVLNVEITAPAFEEGQPETYAGAEVHLFEGGQGYDIMGWSKEAIINDLLNQYHKHIHFLHNIA
ncbi:BCCT family transporter [Suttonella ornithocola]|uniref:Glycine betaine transporter BetP n=1 Tax=Suttonella ornithocola TaxID=279832 RepID=A0A380MXQ5_9GAMM|nr:BCCT family transporter [Suttonella ornithocola]SUO97339.1 Glycine betaine transporter BetP [Suttonella ornithocola]